MKQYKKPLIKFNLALKQDHDRKAYHINENIAICFQYIYIHDYIIYIYYFLYTNFIKIVHFKQLLIYKRKLIQTM